MPAHVGPVTSSGSACLMLRRTRGKGGSCGAGRSGGVGVARRVALAATVALVAAACSSGKSGPASDWATWGFGVERQGFNPHESTIGVGNVGSLKQTWSVELGANIDTAAMVAAGVRVGGKSLDLAYVGTEHGAFYAIDVADGRIVWKKQFRDSDPRLLRGARQHLRHHRRRGHRQARAARVRGDGRRQGARARPGDGIRGTRLAGHGHRRPDPRVRPERADALEGSALRRHREPLRHRSLRRPDLRHRHGDRGQDAHLLDHRRGAPLGGSVWGWGGVSVDPKTGDVFAATGNALGLPENAGTATRSSASRAHWCHWRDTHRPSSGSTTTSARPPCSSSTKAARPSWPRCASTVRSTSTTATRSPTAPGRPSTCRVRPTGSSGCPRSGPSRTSCSSRTRRRRPTATTRTA